MGCCGNRPSACPTCSATYDRVPGKPGVYKCKCGAKDFKNVTKKENALAQFIRQKTKVR